MKKHFSITALLVLMAAGTAWGSGYRIPEQSVDSTAKAGANVAHTPGADSAYFNPANMAWQSDANHLEFGLNYINLPSITYSDKRTPLMNGESEEEQFLLPTFFYVSPEVNDFRFGMSMTVPGGLTKRWIQPYPRTFAEEFELKVIELNPSAAYKICDYFSVGAGLRGIYSEGTVKSGGMINQEYGVLASRGMEGDTTEFGYNLAVTAKPSKKMNLSVTYRSNVDLDLEGDAELWTSASFAGPAMYSGDADVSVPLPAILAIAASHAFDKLTVELEYDRSYWSEYERLDFNYASPLMNPFLAGAFDASLPKNWEDSDSYRIGIEYAVNAPLTLLAGFAIDENPIPDETVGFELPDSDANLYSMGMRYAINEGMEIGLAYLYDDKDSRDAVNKYLNGTIADGGAHLLSAGFAWDF